MTEYFVRLVNFMTMPREEEKGATAVEYGLLVALIAAVIIATVVILGNQINAAFNTVSGRLPAAPAAP